MPSHRTTTATTRIANTNASRDEVGHSGGVTLWEVASGKKARHFKEVQGSVALSPDGKVLAVSPAYGTDGPIRLRCVADGKVVGQFEGHQGGADSRPFAYGPGLSPLRARAAGADDRPSRSPGVSNRGATGGWAPARRWVRPRRPAPTLLIPMPF